ncbi:MAG TPA: peptide chain release factor N(5)-glutamine methyltransferase [Caulobacteraceae bacterium]|nr:peptide chain release factor N(5)-glutamine methyltransferase [Caulobacteraceae bacterium]
MSSTLGQAWAWARDRLRAGGLDEPAIDARLLVEAATGAGRTEIIGDPRRPLSETQQTALATLVERRLRREPVSQILGRKGFWSIMLTVTPHVLTPRPETETLVDLVLRDIPDGRPFTLLDLGVGSGAILLSILVERPAGRGLGVDASEDALAVARENAANLGVKDRVALMRGDWTTGLDNASFDVVVSNPPYVRSADITALASEVRDHDPHLALDGGADGLAAYRRLAPEIMRVAKPGGRFAVEVGAGQARSVTGLFRRAGATQIVTAKDLSGRVRVVAGRRPSRGSS